MFFVKRLCILSSSQDLVYDRVRQAFVIFVINIFDILIACPCGPSIQTVSVKKTKHLELSIKFWLCVKKYLIKFLSNFSSICEKIQTPWTIQFYVVKIQVWKYFYEVKNTSFGIWLCFQKTLGHSQNFTDTIWIVQGVWFFH